MPTKTPREKAVPVLGLNGSNLPECGFGGEYVSGGQISAAFVVNVYPARYTDQLVKELKLEIDNLAKVVSKLKGGPRPSVRPRGSK